MPQAPRVGKLDQSVTVRWSDSTPFNGYVGIGIIRPSYDGTCETDWRNVTIGPHLDYSLPRGFALIPIVEGKYNGTLGMFWNADIKPPNTSYIAYYFDTTKARIAGPTNTFQVTAATFNPPALTLVVPTDSAPAPVPDTTDGSRFVGYVRPWSWNETPAGIQDGVNTAFTLANTPAPTGSLHLTFNGSVLTPGSHFTLVGNALTMIAPFIPLSTDIVRAYYTYGVLTPTFSETLWVFDETPGGLTNSSNSIFVLENAPNPPESLVLIFNGSTLTQDVDYTLSENVIVMRTFLPALGDAFHVSYLYSRCFSRSGGVATWMFGEVPNGSINSSNVVFTVSETPDPAASFNLRFNGSVLTGGIHYNLYGKTIVFNAPYVPAPGDLISCDYLYFVYS